MRYYHVVLSIVATPIGNLKDITERAREALSSCDAVICEDTRVAGKLLHLLGLPKKELISFHGHTQPAKVERILSRLKNGEHLCLTSDAGTPGISDPGYALVSQARMHKLEMEVLPGPSAFLAALSASGLPINRFTYLGFLPVKKGRQTLLASLREEQHTVVFYESPHRIEKTLRELAQTLGDQPGRPLCIARELTKQHEEVRTITVGEIEDTLKTMTVKGEFVVVLGGSV